jgi:biopolymer transport protein ExbB/TolQ
LPNARVEFYDVLVIRRLALVTCAWLLSMQVFVTAPVANAQTPGAQETERERQFVEALRREDPAEADRFVALNDARTQAVNELRRAEAQYNAAGPELRSAFSASLRRAQHKYAEASLALLDFFDARERRAVARYQEEIQRVQKAIEDRQRTRAELQKLLTP